MVFIFNDCEVEESLFSVATTTLIIDRPKYCVYLMLKMTTKLCGLMKASKALPPQEEGSYDDNGMIISTRPSNISEYGA